MEKIIAVINSNLNSKFMKFAMTEPMYSSSNYVNSSFGVACPRVTL